MASEHGADFRMAVGSDDASVWNRALYFWVDYCLVGYCCCAGWPLEYFGFEGMAALREVLGHELY